MAASLRSFRRADAPAVAALSRGALARLQDQVGNPVWRTLEELDGELADWSPPPEDTLVVADEDGHVVGFAGVELPAGFDHAELFGPLVRPTARGHKLGTHLLEASLERTRNAVGIASVVASVGTRNPGGAILLQRKGFRLRGKPQATYRLVQKDHRPVDEAPSEVTIRAGTPDDLAAVLELYRECFPDGRFPDPVWRMTLERGEVTVAEARGEPVAFVTIDPNDRWIYHAGVTGAERKRGVGAYLISSALGDYWAAHPGETLGLDVTADNVPAIRLYRRQGFAPWLVLQPYELKL